MDLEHRSLQRYQFSGIAVPVYWNGGAISTGIFKDRTIFDLQKSIEELTRQVTNLTEAIVQIRHDKYGASSEKHAGTHPDQISFFNEIEVEADPFVSEEPFETDSKGKVRKNNKRVRRDFIIGDIHVEEVLIELEAVFAFPDLSA